MIKSLITDSVLKVVAPSGIVLDPCARQCCNLHIKFVTLDFGLAPYVRSPGPRLLAALDHRCMDACWHVAVECVVGFVHETKTDKSSR
jgi:hypothetical protein